MLKHTNNGKFIWKQKWEVPIQDGNTRSRIHETAIASYGTTSSKEKRKKKKPKNWLTDSYSLGK